MLLIPCPNCGEREETEFHYGGQAHVHYPEDPSAVSDTEWAQYLFYRDNPRGYFAERWCHTGGCRKWFNAIRDTVSYTFIQVYPMGQPCPVDLGPAAAPEPASAPEPPPAPTSRTTGGTAQ